MISSEWDEFPDYGDANIPASSQVHPPRKEEEKGSFFGNVSKNFSNAFGIQSIGTRKPPSEPFEPSNQELSWDEFPDYGDANIPNEKNLRKDQHLPGAAKALTAHGNEEKEGYVKDRLRTGAQIPLGMLNATPIPVAADLMQMWGYAEAMQGFEELKDAGIPFDEQKYMQAVNDAMKMYPSQRNFEKLAEHYTGIPLEPKTGEQEAIRFGSGFIKNLFQGIANPSTYRNQPWRHPSQENGGFIMGRPPGAPPPPPGAPPPPNISPDLIGTQPGHSYERTQNALNFIKANEPSPSTPNIPSNAQTSGRVPIPQAQTPTRGTNLRTEHRLSHRDRAEIGLNIEAPPPRHATQEQRVLGHFPEHVESAERAGEAALTVLRTRADETRAVHAHLYDLADELTPLIAEPRYDIQHVFTQRINDFKKISPSPTQQALISDMQGVIDKMSVIGEDGKFLLDANGQRVLEPWTNKQVLDQAKAFRQNLEYGFMPGNSGNEYIPIISELTDSARAAAVIANAPEAAQAITAADNAFRNWSRVYNNDYIKGLRDPNNIFPVKSYESLLQHDHFRIASEILQESPQGRELISGFQREIVEKRLRPFLDNPRAHAGDLQKELRNLEGILTPEQMAQVRREIAARHEPMRRHVRQIRTPEQVERAVSKYLKMDPEDLRRGMNNVTDMRDIRARTQGTNHFENLVEDKTRSIAFKGKLEDTPTNEQLYDRFINEKNAELLIEMHGRTTYNELVAAARVARDAERAAAEAEAAAGHAARTQAQQEALARQARKDSFKKYKTAAKIAAYIGLL